MARRFKSVATFPLLLGALGAGCAVGDAPASSHTRSPGAEQSAAPCTSVASFGAARITLLTDEQYVNIANDVFGVTLKPTITAPQSTTGVYGMAENAVVQTTTLQAYLHAADQIADSIQPCSGRPVDAKCMEQYLRLKLPLAWRRPVTDEEIARLMPVFNGGLPSGASRAVELTMEAALAAPSFLYRTELGRDPQANGSVPLTPFELASALSFALFNSVPDAELWAKAQDGSLVQPDVLKAEVTRLVALPTVRANLKKKVSYYLNFEQVRFVTKDPALF